jgi:hypothetical protein
MKSAEEWVDTVVVFNEDAARAIQLDALKEARYRAETVDGLKLIEDLIAKLEKQNQ